MTEAEFEARMLLAGWEQHEALPSYWWHSALFTGPGTFFDSYHFFPRGGDVEEAWDKACAVIEAKRGA